MTIHVTIPIEPDELDRARALAAERGVPLEQYLHDLLANALPAPRGTPTTGIEALFDLVTDGEPTDIGRDKDKMVAEAVWKHHLEETGQK